MQLRSFFVLGGMCVALAACSNSSPSPYYTGNGKSDLKIGKPYIIEGRTYIPAYNPTYVEVGTASWYGPGFHGRQTANGDRFDENGLTAAHRTLPLPCLVRVTNLDNNRDTILKVNDRGPFKKNRILDLSKAAAKELGVFDTGTAQVRVEYLHEPTRQMILAMLRDGKLNARQQDLAAIDMSDALQIASNSEVESKSVAFNLIRSAEAADVEKAAPINPVQASEGPPMLSPKVEVLPMSAPVQPLAGASATELASVSSAAGKPSLPLARNAPLPTAGLWKPSFIQTASFSKKESADALLKKMEPVSYGYVKSVEINGRVWYRVRLGPQTSFAESQEMLKKVHDLGYHDAHVVTD